MNNCLGIKFKMKNTQLFWNNLLASLLLSQHNLVNYGNVMLSEHNFKLGNINLSDMSEVATTSVLVILELPRIYNYNLSNT